MMIPMRLICQIPTFPNAVLGGYPNKGTKCDIGLPLISDAHNCLPAGFKMACDGTKRMGENMKNAIRPTSWGERYVAFRTFVGRNPKSELPRRVMGRANLHPSAPSAIFRPHCPVSKKSSNPPALSALAAVVPCIRSAKIAQSGWTSSPHSCARLSPCARNTPAASAPMG